MFGSVANVINIIVLTRKSMVSSTNAILTGLAITDLLVMVRLVLTRNDYNNMVISYMYHIK